MQQIKSILIGWIETSRVCLSFNKISWGYIYEHGLFKRFNRVKFKILFVFRNVLLSFQGFFITLPYCFLNSEVCTMIKSHFDRWRDRSNIGYGPASARNSIAMQGMFNVNDARKRSSFGYHNVTTTTMVDDKVNI